MNFLQNIIGCRHSRYSWPLTQIQNVNGFKIRYTHVCCLECGQKLAYSLDEMKVTGRAA